MSTQLMTNHRAGAEGEWRKIDRSEWNRSQRLAEFTNGYVTAANLITLVGGGTVLSGINDLDKDQYLKGVLKIAAGRSLDVVDGYVAHRLGVKSPVGEATDASVDGALTMYAAYKLQRIGVIPTEFALALGVQQGANIGFTALAKRRGNEIHTGASGKLSQGAKWAAIGFYSTAYLLENSDTAKMAHKIYEAGMDDFAQSVLELDTEAVAEQARKLATVTAIGSIAGGSAATLSYARQALAT